LHRARSGCGDTELPVPNHDASTVALVFVLTDGGPRRRKGDRVHGLYGRLGWREYREK
jgi:hypothetical protein